MRKERKFGGVEALGCKAGLVLVTGLVLLSSACVDEPPPRTFADFMEDRIAREGTLARCNLNREATLNDIECANARRAASAIALRLERDRREDLERESERKLADLRDQMMARERAARDSALAAAAAEREAYERLWREQSAAAARAGQTVGGAGVVGNEPAGDGLSLVQLPRISAPAIEAAASASRKSD